MKNSQFFGRHALIAGIATALVLMFTISAIPAAADNLFVCNGCSAAPSGDPVVLTSVSGASGFQIGLSGNKSSVAPILLIVGTYDGAAAPSISYTNASNVTTVFNPGGTALYGWNGSSTGVTFNGSNSNAYAALGIGPLSGGQSENFGNWNTGEVSIGLAAATSYTLYVYELNGVNFTGNGTITLDMNGGTTGDYILGYACETSGTPCSNGKVGDTPFTTAGLDDAPNTPTPEPGALLLLGTGLLGVAGFLRKFGAK